MTSQYLIKLILIFLIASRKFYKIFAISKVKVIRDIADNQRVKLGMGCFPARLIAEENSDYGF